VHHQLFIRMLTGGDLIVEAPVTPEWKGRNARALLALLAMQPGERVARDRLAGLLWPESDQHAARANLRMTLLGLRRTLEPLGSGLLGVSNETVTLNLGRDAVDSSLFEMLCARSDVESRAEALTLYRGDYLADLAPPSEAFDDLLRTERERLRTLAISTGLALIAILEREEPGDRLSSVVGRLLAIDPANEPAHRAMMRAHMAAGDRAAALRQFDQCRAALRGHYDLDPSPETVALRDAITDSPRGGSIARELLGEGDAAGDRDSGIEVSRPDFAVVRGRRGKRYLAAGALLALIGVLVWWIWSSRSPPENGPSGERIQMSIAPIDAELSHCRHQGLERDFRLLLEEALIAMPNVAVILQGSGGGVGEAGAVYVLEVHLQCRNTDFRVSLTVQRSGLGIADWVGQYDDDGRTLKAVVQRIMEDIRPILETGRHREPPAGRS
jgi:DNA-binding SARP family transcriptional activator